MNKQYDDDILKIVKEIFDDSYFTIETFNESILVELMKAKGTPIMFDRCFRNTEKDFNQWKKGKENAMRNSS